MVGEGRTCRRHRCKLVPRTVPLIPAGIDRASRSDFYPAPALHADWLLCPRGQCPTAVLLKVHE